MLQIGHSSDRARFHDAFAHDLPEADTRIMAATQKPIYGKSFGETVPAAGWKTIPLWYVVSTEDQSSRRPRNEFGR